MVKNAKKKRGKVKIFATRQKGRFLSFLSQFVGAIMAIAAGISFGILCVHSVWRRISLGQDAFLFLFLFVVGCVLYYNGRKVRKLLSRFRYYRRLLDGREYVTLEELSELTGRKVAFLRQDLKNMIKRKLFLQGRMDKKETCLILTDAAYEKYCMTAASMEETPVKEERTEYMEFMPEEEILDGEWEMIPDAEEENTEVPKNFRDDAEGYLIFYEKIQKQLKDKEIQRIVTDLGVYTVRILAYDIETADREKFLTSYLPVTKELLLLYKEMEEAGVAEGAKTWIDELCTIRYSFETFANNLSEGRGMDVETDILASYMMFDRV